MKKFYLLFCTTLIVLSAFLLVPKISAQFLIVHPGNGGVSFGNWQQGINGIPVYNSANGAYVGTTGSNFFFREGAGVACYLSNTGGNCNFGLGSSNGVLKWADNKGKMARCVVPGSPNSLVYCAADRVTWTGVRLENTFANSGEINFDAQGGVPNGCYEVRAGCYNNVYIYGGSACGSGGLDIYTNYTTPCPSCTLPSTPSNPTYNGSATSTNVGLTPTLAWTQSNWGTMQTSNSSLVYLWNNATCSSSAFASCSQNGQISSDPFSCFRYISNGLPIAALTPGTSYCWSAMAYVNPACSGRSFTQGPNWSFTTVAATPTPTPTLIPTPTPTPSGNVQARAVVVPTGASCAQTQASTNGISGTVNSLTGVAPAPPPLTQSGSSYVVWNNIKGGVTPYTLSQTLPNGTYTAVLACWRKTLNSPSSGTGFTTTLSSPVNLDTITWDVGYTADTPWVQVGGGGNVVSGDYVRSLIPPGVSPRVFATDGTGGYPGLVTYGNTYDFDPGAGVGGTYVSSKNWLAQDIPPFPKVDYYTMFWAKTGGPITPDFTGAILTAFPIPGSPTGRTTPYYIVGDVTIPAAGWVIGAGYTGTVIINGNLTINGPITLGANSFLAFIVKGNITIGSGVGTTYASPATNLEGIYLTSPTGTISTGTSLSGTERLNAHGIFGGGNMTLQRSLSIVGQNNNYPAETFSYFPELLLRMPDILRDVSVVWEEVAP